MNFEKHEDAINHIRETYPFVFVQLNEKTRLDREAKYSLKKEKVEVIEYTSIPCRWSRLEEIKDWKNDELSRFFLTVGNDGKFYLRTGKLFR
jgi:hypothetical protein